MPLTYDQDSRLKDLLPVLDEYGEWVARVMRQVFYPESEQDPQVLAIPGSFKNWAVQAAKDEVIAPEILLRLQRINDDLGLQADRMVKDALASRFKPELKRYDAFMTLYDEFVVHVRRLERDMAVTDSGFDVLTGLRSRQMLMVDLAREMERRSRRGKPFCLALARIDHYDRIKANLPGADFENLLRAVADIIKLCMRSFDDAYRLGDGEFLMSLKQTDMSGGTAGLTRLRKLLEERAPYYTMDGREMRLTMSSCVAEPQPGDALEDLMAHMRQDLDRFGGDAETALEHLEVSPLQRFVHGLDDESKKTH